MRPELRSASIAICLPGIASSVNLAATSATRSAPLVMTRNCTSTIMKKITKPTTTLPCSTKLPKDLMTCPASPPRDRMFRVEDTLMPRRNRVVIRSRDGKMENSSAPLIFMLMIRIINDTAIFMMIMTSSINGLIGMIKSKTMTTTKSVTALLVSRFLMFTPFFGSACICKPEFPRQHHSVRAEFLR